MPEWLRFVLFAGAALAVTGLIVYLLAFSLVHNRWPWDRDNLD